MIDPLIKPAAWPTPLPFREIFERDGPLEVDLGCGKGRFLAARAAAFPDTNFLGIDRQRARIRKAMRKVANRGLANVRLLLVEALHAVDSLLPPDSVSTFYVFFPDPWPKRRHRRRRLFSAAFLESLHRAMKPAAEVHIATDHVDYDQDIRAALLSDSRFREIPPFCPGEEERTEFERIFVGLNRPIRRCSFRKASPDQHHFARSADGPPTSRP